MGRVGLCEDRPLRSVQLFMIPKLRRSAACAALSMLTLPISTACVDDTSALFIRGVIRREAPACIAEPDPGAVLLASGTLDVALASEYFATFLVGNQYTARDGTQTHTESSRVVVQEAEITLRDSDGTQIAPAFTVAGSGAAPPNVATDPGWGVFGAVVIPEGATRVAGALGVIPSVGWVDDIDVHIRVRGQTAGGQNVESGEFVFPVHVCYGCLVSYPQSALVTDQTTGVTTCSAPMNDVPVTGCSFGQDDPVDCRSCTSLAVCRTVPPAP